MRFLSRIFTAQTTPGLVAEGAFNLFVLLPAGLFAAYEAVTQLFGVPHGWAVAVLAGFVLVCIFN